MFNFLSNKLIELSNGSPNKRTPLLLINSELNQKVNEKGKKRVSHPFLWERNKQKIFRHSVNFKLIYFKIFIRFN